MRRKEKMIVDQRIIDEIMASAKVCRLGLADDNIPYIVPICFGYQAGTLYFHSAPEGKKIDILRKNPKVCFEFDRGVELIPAEKPCQWGMRYQSIIGYGKAVFLETVEEKRQALRIIMDHYAEGNFSFQESTIAKTAVFKVVITELTGKQSGI